MNILAHGLTPTQAKKLKDVYKLLCEIRDHEPETDKNGRVEYAAALGRCQGKAEVALIRLDAIAEEDQ